MEVAKSTDAAIVVSSEWRDLGPVKLFIGPPDNNPEAKGDGSSVLEAQIMDALDDRGLWIEFNSGQKKWPDRPTQKLMVPWRFVLAIILQPDPAPQAKKIGYETSEPVPTSQPVPT